MSRDAPSRPDWAREGGSREGAAEGRAGPAGSGFLPAWAEAQGPSAAPPASKPVGHRASFMPPWSSGRREAAAAGAADVRPLLVRGGKVLIPGQGILELDLALEGGRVRALGRDLDPAGAQVIEAAGKLVIPGVIDPHVHLGIYGDFRGELETETRSALATGVTSFGLYAGGTEPYLKTLDATIGAIDSLSRADIFIHLPIFTREQLEEIPVYASRYGIMSFKVYMCGIPGIIPAADDAFLFDVMEEVARLGSEAVLCVHAENQSLVERAIALGLDREPGGLDPAAWNASRPSYVEEEAIRRVEFLARKAGVKVYIVHVSSADGVAAIRELKASGRRILAETTSPFLSLEPGSGRDSRTLMAPPVRGGADRAALWSGLRDGTLDSIGTDHTPLSSGQKRLGSRYPEALLGYPAIGTHLPSIIDACLGSGFPLELAVEKLTRRPAEIFGLYPRKGTLLPGSDADLAIIDLSKTEVVSPGRTASRADFSLHEGERLAGWPDLVVKGGIVQVQGSAPTGRYLRRGRSRRT